MISNFFTLMLLAACFWSNEYKMMQKNLNMTETHMGTHLRVLSASFPMNTNMTGFRIFQKSLRPCALGESTLSIGRVDANSWTIFRTHTFTIYYWPLPLYSKLVEKMTITFSKFDVLKKRDRFLLLNYKQSSHWKRVKI